MTRHFLRSSMPVAAILLLASSLIFFRLDRADLQTDGAVYSLRALGYLDYLNTPLQSTPLQWFATPPWWTRLSFHDAPPLVLLIQFVFFSFLGTSTVVARLPGALAGVGSVGLVMVIGRRLWGERAGLVAGLLLATSTLLVWAAREPYLESVEIFFILGNLWVLVRAVRDPRWWPWWGVTLGLALMTKYTAFVVVPAAVVYLAVFARRVFHARRFGLGVALAVLVASPLLVYNTGVYFSRGHLDLQLSRLVPSTWERAHAAWPKLYAQVGGARDWLGNATSMFTYLRAVMSWPEFLVMLAGVGWLTWLIIRHARSNPLALVPWVGLVALGAFFTFNGPAPRLLPVAIPLLALAAAGCISQTWSRWSPRVPTWGRAVLLGAVALVFVGETAYNINTNHLLVPLGPPAWQATSLRLGNDGFQQLAEFLAPRFAAQPGFTFHRPLRRDQILSDFTRLPGQDLFVYQADLRWFSAFWYFQRYSIYHDVYVLSDVALAAVAEHEGRPLQMPQFFQAFGVRRVHYIVGVAPGVFESGFVAPSVLTQSLAQSFAVNLNRGARGESVEIKNPTGQVAFRVYTLEMNQ